MPARFARRARGVRPEAAAVLARRLAGFLLLGGVPLVLVNDQVAIVRNPGTVMRTGRDTGP